MNFQWYPGHMTKAKRAMEEDIRLVDLVIEILDARIPLSSRNPDIDRLGQNKYRLILLNKADLASDAVTKQWEKYFAEKGIRAVRMNSKAGGAAKSVQSVVNEVCREKIERDRKRGILNRPVRAMVVGIPNVGKSTFINSFSGRASAKTGNKPGVTKANQWIRLNKNVELLDTPGILWPKFEDQEIGLKIAFIGSINEEIIDLSELALLLIETLKRDHAGAMSSVYPVDESSENLAILQKIAEARGCLKKEGELDLEKASRILLDDFRSGKLGKISLEAPKLS